MSTPARPERSVRAESPVRTGTGVRPEVGVVAVPATGADPSARQARLGGRDSIRLAVVVAVASAAAAVYLSVDVQGNVAYVLDRRLTTLATMAVVGAAVALSTVMFQTVTHNRILTPSVMGFDALYLLVQSLAVALLGVGALAGVPPLARFGLEVAAMLAFSLGLYGWLIGRLSRHLHLLVLIGMVVGVFFRSVTQFVQRILDPTAFVVVQDAMFADFTDADPTLLAISSVVVLAVGLVAWRTAPTLDVMALGHDTAIGLGVAHRRTTIAVLVMASVLVAVSTALVGPTTFFGLLVVHLGYRLVRSGRHRTTVPAAVAVAFAVLVVGQLLLERLLGLDSALAVAVEFLGGVAFLLLLTRRTH